jgi:hypothetical protein
MEARVPESRKIERHGLRTDGKGRRVLAMLLLTFTVNISAAEIIQIGQSAEGIDINGYSFGTGNNCLIVIGGIHGRYEENTVLITKRLIDYCHENENRLKCTVKIIPNLNPDGFRYGLDDPIVKANGSAVRFNGNSVDLNRNWDTPNWQSDCAYSQNDIRAGAGGKKPMSEPEVIGLSNLILNCKDSFEKTLVISLHSYVVNKQVMSDVFPSYIINERDEIVLLEEAVLAADLFAKDGNFIKLNKFEYYTVTGELLYWCGINNVPALDIELSDNGSIDKKQNNQKSHWESFIECFTVIQSFGG